MERIYSTAESDEYESVSYVAQRPRKRDFLKVLTGRYVPTVERDVRLTAKGTSRVLKNVWTSEAVEGAFHAPNPLLDRLRDGSA